MNRRKFIAGLGSAGRFWPIAAHAQQDDRLRSLSLETLHTVIATTSDCQLPLGALRSPGP
jgi:hypothetical protein